MLIMFLILIWNKKRFIKFIIDFNIHIAKHMKLNLLIMLENIEANIDSRYYVNNNQWRDKMRRQLLFLTLELISISIILKCKENSKLILSYMLANLWMLILDWLNALSAKFTVIFLYILKIINIKNYSYKYESASLIIVEILEENKIKNIIFKKKLIDLLNVKKALNKIVDV